jgi:hypothetical protein
LRSPLIWVWDGRTIKTVTAELGVILILFDDESRMKIKTAGNLEVPPGDKIKSVLEDKAEFEMEFEDSSGTTF